MDCNLSQNSTIPLFEAISRDPMTSTMTLPRQGGEDLWDRYSVPARYAQVEAARRESVATRLSREGIYVVLEGPGLEPSLIIDVPVEADLRRINKGVDAAGAARRLDRPGIYWSVREKSPFWMLIEAMSFLLVSSRTKSNTGFSLEGYSYDLGPAASTSSTAS